MDRTARVARSALVVASGIGRDHQLDPGIGPVKLAITGTHGKLTAPTSPIDCGNSGTTMRLLSGILAGQPFTTASGLRIVTISTRSRWLPITSVISL